jgi:hypothetical protein
MAMATHSNSTRLFTFITRDVWGRPVRRFNHNALAVTLLSSALGTVFLWAASSDTLTTTLKLADRLVQSF